MGGCASKPKVLKEETGAPLVIDEPKKKVGDNEEKGRGEVVKEQVFNVQEECKKSGNRSLGLLLMEMKAKDDDQLEREQIIDEFETKMTTMIQEESTTDLKEESKNLVVDARPDELVISKDSALPVYSSVKVFF